VILVGGGSVLIGDELVGAGEIRRPEHYRVANAIGAAIAQVSGEVDQVYSLGERGREAVLQEAQASARARAIEAGAEPASVEIVELEEVPLAYLPSNAIRVRVKAAGALGLG
jgi:N-methylhydantoinase A/oxoprolinase/acetone carboxylase beta subunit